MAEAITAEVFKKERRWFMMSPLHVFIRVHHTLIGNFLQAFPRRNVLNVNYFSGNFWQLS